jgi:hypothetical protein
MWFLTHFQLLHHLFQMMASASTRSTQMENSGCITATTLLWINDIENDQYRPALLFKNKLALIHVECGCWLIFKCYIITYFKWWPQCQLGASKRKTVVGITATTLLWINDMEYDWYRHVLSTSSCHAILRSAGRQTFAGRQCCSGAVTISRHLILCLLCWI